MKIAHIASATLLCLIMLNISCAYSGSDKAAAVSTFSLNGADGKNFNLDEILGKKTIMLIFFATWCPYCRDEVPELKELSNAYKDKGVEIIAIDIKESEQKIKSFIAENKINYKVLMDTDGKVARMYKVVGIPHAIIIDKDKNIRFRGVSPGDGFKKFLDDLIK